jgi:hypothetical protein
MNISVTEDEKSKGSILWRCSLLLEEYMKLAEWNNFAGEILVDYQDGEGWQPRAHYLIEPTGKKAALFYYPGLYMEDPIGESAVVAFLHALKLTRRGINAASRMDGFNKLLVDGMCRQLIRRFGDGLRVGVYKSVTVREYYKKEGEWCYADLEIELMQTLAPTPKDKSCGGSCGTPPLEKQDDDGKELPFYG